MGGSEQIAGVEFDRERFIRWTDALMTLQYVGQPVTHLNNTHWLWIAELMRGLARLDAKLVVEDRWAVSLFGKEEWLEVERDRFNDHATLSQLWVLGAYEILRTAVAQYKKKVNEDKARHERRRKEIKKLNKRQGQKKLPFVGFKPDPLLLRMDNLLVEFERLRMPMAKLEPAGAFKSDNPVARPALSSDGLGWITSPDFFVTRNAVAEKMISVLEGHTREEIDEFFLSLNERFAALRARGCK